MRNILGLLDVCFFTVLRFVYTFSIKNLPLIKKITSDNVCSTLDVILLHYVGLILISPCDFYMNWENPEK